MEYAWLKKKWYRPDEVAAIVMESRWTVYSWIRRGKLQAHELPGGQLRIEDCELNRITASGHASAQGSHSILPQT